MRLYLVISVLNILILSFPPLDAGKDSRYPLAKSGSYQKYKQSLRLIQKNESRSIYECLHGVYICRLCCTYEPFTRDTSKKIQDHVMRVHYKPWKCKICTKSFGYYGDITRHYKDTQCTSLSDVVVYPRTQKKVNKSGIVKHKGSGLKVVKQPLIVQRKVTKQDEEVCYLKQRRFFEKLFQGPIPENIKILCKIYPPDHDLSDKL